MKTKPSYQDLREKVVQLTAANAALQTTANQFEEVKRINNNLVKEYNDLQEQNDRLTEINGSLRGHAAQYEDLRKAYDQLVKSYEALTSQCESIEKSESIALTDLRKAKAVAEYWKIRAEASEKLMQALDS